MKQDLCPDQQNGLQATGQQEVLQYDNLPETFRNQVIHILNDTLGEWLRAAVPLGTGTEYFPTIWWTEIYNDFIRERGLEDSRHNQRERCIAWVKTGTTEVALHFIAVAFQYIDFTIRNDSTFAWEQRRICSLRPDEAIAQLNRRFREHGIGYQFTEGRIVRLDSQFIHKEAVRPALQLLSGAGPEFAGPLEEFLKAHDHYRTGNHKDGITWGLKAFESTLKSICAARRWNFNPDRDTAATLLNIVFANQLVPPYLQTEFTALRSVLESGVPTIRNKTSGHGQGSTPTDIPRHFVSFVLHLTASNIVFLIESFKALP